MVAATEEAGEDSREAQERGTVNCETEVARSRTHSLGEETGLCRCLKSDASASWDPCALFAALWLDVHLLQAAAKQKAKHELQQSKKDEKQRADSKAAASCATIKHIWQLEPTEREFEEDAKRCMLKLEEFSVAAMVTSDLRRVWSLL